VLHLVAFRIQVISLIKAWNVVSENEKETEKVEWKKRVIGNKFGYSTLNSLCPHARLFTVEKIPNQTKYSN